MTVLPGDPGIVLPQVSLQVDSGSTKPPPEVIEALESGVVHVTRRIEVYEADGKTLWNPDPELDPQFHRLVDGSVTVDYNSDERRKLDLVLDNRDNLLRPDPVDGLWYDKVIKIFRGLYYKGSMIAPRAAIIEAPDDAAGRRLRSVLSSLGFDKTVYLTGVTSATDLSGYSFIVAFTATADTAYASLLNNLWRQGKHVVTIGTGTTHESIPLYSASTPDNVQWGVSPAAGDHPAVGGFGTAAVGVPTAGARPTALAAGAVAVSVYPDAVAPTMITAALGTSPQGTYWFDVHLPDISTQQPKLMVREVLNFMRGYESNIHWEAQQGEFLIDTINADHFPDHVKITGRDYTKKLINSKLSNNLSFAAGTSVETLVRALAANGGIDPNKFKVAMEDEVISSEMAFERGTDRWAIIKEACHSFNYEVFFDALGYFVVRHFADPSSAPTSWTFKTGYEANPEGANLVEYSRSMSDSRIFNHVACYSDPSDAEERLPYFGEAENNEASSPTRIERLGRRTLTVETNWLGSDQECREYAKSRLRISALESYEISFSSIYYSWFDAGEIVEILDPDRTEIEPTKFLMDTITYPLGLAPMSATAKRITYVGSPGSPDDIPEEV